MSRVLVIAGFPDSLVGFRQPLLDAMLAAGHTLHVAAPDLPEGDAVRGRLETRGMHVHEIALRRAGTNPLADIRSWFCLWRLMARVRPSHVFAYTVKPVIYGLLAARVARVPRRFALITGVGYAFSDGADPERRLLWRLVRWLYATALRGADAVFFQNPDDEAHFRSTGALSADTPSVIVNGSGVDLSEYGVEPLPGGVRFLMIARLLGEKGVREYVEAARRLREHHPEVRFSLVGWIDENPDSVNQDELDGWIAEGVIEFLGRMDDVRPAIADCSVYVLPSYHEGTPRTVLEAMAMGRAIITTDAPGCRETVEDGVNGLLVPVRSVDALASAMERVIKDPGVLGAMGSRSRERAVARYDVHNVNDSMLEVMGL